MSCCGRAPESVVDLLHSALARPRWHGPAATGSAGDPLRKLRAEILLETGDGRIVRADYRCTTCASLIAYCEAMVRMISGLELGRTAALEAGDLIRRVRGVPACRHDRAHLAVAAMRAALREVLQQPSKD